MNHRPSGAPYTLPEGVEIKLWESYIIRSRVNLLDRLSAYAIDKGPWRGAARESERVTFRFFKFDWDRTVKVLLDEQSVPYEIVNVFQFDVAQSINKKRVYVAEDDLNILFALDTMLEDAGYDVTLSHCGSPMLEKNAPVTDVYILDNKMPDINGVDVCRHLKAQDATKHVPVIMISAVRNFGREALKAGVDDYLEKPFQMKELLRLVAKHTTRQSNDFPKAHL
jgi:CheY-like chemotaxis protein